MALPPALAPDSVLARCVGDVEVFAAHYWGRWPLLTTPSDRLGDDVTDAFGDVLSLEAVDELITLGARLPTIRMVVDGAPLALSRFCLPTRLGGRNLDDVVDPVKVVARLADGATLVMQSLHRTAPRIPSRPTPTSLRPTPQGSPNTAMCERQPA